MNRPRPLGKQEAVAQPPPETKLPEKAMRSSEAEEEAGSPELLVPAAITRTSAELLNRPLPRFLAGRPVRFILGPFGVGKSAVALRIAGPNALVTSGEGLRAALTQAARYKQWPEALDHAPVLILDEVDCLHGRYGALDLLGGLLNRRALAGLPTMLCQGLADTSMTLLYDAVPLHLRATILLRFPVGRGRRRYVKQRCDVRGIDPRLALAAVALDPWTYRGVEVLLDALDPKTQTG